jgi:hypothetical protein
MQISKSLACGIHGVYGRVHGIHGKFHLKPYANSTLLRLNMSKSKNQCQFLVEIFYIEFH